MQTTNSGNTFSVFPEEFENPTRVHSFASLNPFAQAKYISSLSGMINDMISSSQAKASSNRASVFLLVINTAVLRRPPPSTTCVSVVLVCVQGASFTMSYHADGEQEQFNWIGVVFGLAAAFCEVSGDALIEYMTTDESSDESSADILRVLVMNEAWKLPVTVVFCFIFDS